MKRTKKIRNYYVASFILQFIVTAIYTALTIVSAYNGNFIKTVVFAVSTAILGVWCGVCLGKAFSYKRINELYDIKHKLMCDNLELMDKLCEKQKEEVYNER